MITDRYYQTDAVDSIWNYFRTSQGNPVVAMPTGTGKSVVIGRFLRSVFDAYPGQRVMVLTHVKELIEQNYNKLMMMWPFAPAGVYSAGLKRRDVGKPVTFAGIQSVWRRAMEFGHVDLLMIDEAHLVPLKTSTMYQKFVSDLKIINPNLKIIGLTATPWRLGQGRIIDPIEIKGELVEPLFTDICYDNTGVEDFNKLIAEGFLSPLRAKRTQSVLESDNIHMRGGEFIESELQSFVDQHDELTHAALKEAQETAEQEGRKSWLVFGTGVDHTETISAMLDDMGVSNGVIHTRSKGRDKLIEAHRRGDITALINNNVLTVGYDNPLIDLMLVLRQTASSVLWGQMLGRGTRPLYAPGHDIATLEGRLAAIAEGGKPNCRVLDFAGNTRRLGPINDPVIPRAKGKGGGDAPVKACDRCDEWIHASLRECPYCGYEFEFETKLKAEASSQELVRGDEPVVEVFKIDHVTASEHRKQGRPPSVRLSYYSGLRSSFSDYLCVAHEGFARRKASQLWREMADDPEVVVPVTSHEALERLGEVRMPTHLRVWVNKKYPEILARCYDGTAFGTEEPCEAPSLEGARQTAPIAGLASDEDYDDDVPF